MKKTLSMTLEERQNVPFDLVGEKFKIKMANLPSLCETIRDQRKQDGLGNIITLLPSKINKFSEPNYLPTYVRDPINSVFYGIIVGWHPDGNPKWLKIPMKEFLELDLSRDHDCQMWAVLRMHPEVDISPLAVSEPKFLVHDPEVEAAKQLSKATLISNVLAKARTMNKDDIRYFARWCDIPLNGSESPGVIRAKLTEVAIERPEFFQEKLNDKDRPVGEIFKSAKMIGLVKHDMEKGYQYKDIWLGLTDYEAIEFLSRENNVVTSIKDAVAKLDMQAAPKIEEE